MQVSCRRLIVDDTSHFEMRGTMYDAPFVVEKSGNGDYRLVIDAIREVVGAHGHDLSFGDLRVRLVPIIPARYLASGEVPSALDLDSRMAATTSFTSPKLPFVARATHVSEHSMLAMMQSAIDAAADAVLIENYLRT